jgi:hypothetical protein
VNTISYEEKISDFSYGLGNHSFPRSRGYAPCGTIPSGADSVSGEENNMKTRTLIFVSIAITWGLVLCVPPGRAENHREDTDKDGWPDEFEVLLGTDPGSHTSLPDSLGDRDQDGLSNEEERQFGTDPSDPDSDDDHLSDEQEIRWRISNPNLKDTDNDGLSDFEEVLNNTNPQMPDTDADGWLDSAEINADSDPADPSSTPTSKE